MLNRVGPVFSRYTATLRQPPTSLRKFSMAAVCSSGHNRWSKIFRDKGANDIKKSRVYSQVSAEIINAIRKGGTADPSNNLQLSVALRKARDLNVPKDNINAALAKATSPQSPEDVMQVNVYEAIGPGHTPLLIECMSNNTNRTFKRMKELLADHGCRMAPVAYMFSRKGKILLTPREGVSFDEVWEAAVDANALDVELIEGDEGGDGEGHGELGEEDRKHSQQVVEVTTEPSDLTAISTTLSAPPHSHTITSMELVYIPATASSEVEADSGGMDEETATKLKMLLDELRDEADCENVWTLNGI